ncbi:MAG: DUF1194 domain-containing protein [Rhizobiaceae bacterium]
MVRHCFAYAPAWFACIIGAFSCAKPVSCSAQQHVALELVLAIDTSTSVDEREFILQRNGLASAFRDPSVIRSIENLGPTGAAIALVQWAGPGRQSLSIGWQVLTDAASAHHMAQAIEHTARAHTGFTDIGDAIAFSTTAIETNIFEGKRKAIDVSGDGVSDRNNPVPFRNIAIGKGITINGLIIYSQEYDLGELARFELHDHYSQRVIGGSGAFLMEADSFDEFAEAMRRKLVREISGANVVKALQPLHAALSDSTQAR